jgi:hypothetical protein
MVQRTFNRPRQRTQNNAQSDMSGALRHFAVANPEFAQVMANYVEIPEDKRTPKDRVLYGASLGYSNGIRSIDLNVERAAMNILDAGLINEWSGNARDKFGLVISGTAPITVGQVFKTTLEGYKAYYDQWLVDGSTVEGQEVEMPVIVVLSAMHNTGGEASDPAKRKANRNLSFLANNERLSYRIKDLHKNARALKGESVHAQFQGDVICGLRPMSDGSYLGLVYVPFHTDMVGTGDTITDRRGFSRKQSATPKEQIACIGGVELGHTPSA